MDPEGCPQGGSTADTLEECGRRKRKYHCTLPGFLFSPGIGDPERNQRDTADPTGPPAPGHQQLTEHEAVFTQHPFFSLRPLVLFPTQGGMGLPSVLKSSHSLSPLTVVSPFLPSDLQKSSLFLVLKTVSDISSLQKWIGCSVHSHSFRSHGSSPTFLSNQLINTKGELGKTKLNKCL